MIWDPTIILLIPALILAGWAQFKVQSTFARYSQVPSSRQITGAEMAATLLRRGGLHSVRIERVPGNLTDHYDPRSKVLRLSDSVYGSNSVAALGVAAHEVGHALQHETNYLPLGIRNAIVPVASFASSASFPLILIGLLFGLPDLATLGVLIFTAVVAFQLITLPVEFNASSRAVALLQSGGHITSQEVPMVKKVLGAAALTYVAAALVSFLNLVRFLLILGVFHDE
ncbi:MAG: zinc metallopeptidase [Syntrophomonadaceae bacterium]|nr:zinc metallopeptidase [Syntrophomonadaceae bacterium]